ncbi:MULTISPECIES: glycosyltransferase [unclassified Janthinobacterium]|uniref:glycosyltransferase n=1 Tax=unclassified Janthinobacterium TaxID=2610881 RepID=UPI00036951DA|nr:MULTISPECIES: glycosyltransferase [unclassified Janthinobacterium]MEC5159793.1 hypothetical protein [Janthinobacterium sp. CG_S6]
MNTTTKAAPPRATPPKPVRLHLTNIIGLGATQLLRSLLPSLESLPGYRLETLYLPASGPLAAHIAADPRTRLALYRRYLPNALSRVLECTLFGAGFDGATPLLVLGDIPLRCRARQTVFVQNSLLTKGADTGHSLGALKYYIAKCLFKRNMQYVAAFIVQTEAMKAALLDSYPQILGRVHVIAQPAPDWLLASQLRRGAPRDGGGAGLRLFYPAAGYPHKNHGLFGELGAAEGQSWPVAEVVLTIPQSLHPNPALSWLRCVDRLEPDQVIAAYGACDALLFMSLTESFGFPLVEAMWIGLPVVCPDLPYARAQCGDQALYFDVADAASLGRALAELHSRLADGWWPDWSERLRTIPRDWAEVGEAMLSLAAGADAAPAA